ncbi:MAG: S41 family peptidase [Gemmatimonadales bacterium]
MRQRLGWLLIGVILGASGAIVVERWIALHRAGPVTTAGVFQDVMSAIRRSFVDSLSDDELYQKAAKGVVSSLGDPYSSFLAPTEAQNYRDNLRGTSASLGLSLRRGLSGYYVQSVVSGSTADQAGLAPGTYLLELNGKSTERQSPDQLRYALATLEGPAAVVVRRPGDSLADSLTLTPEPTTYPAVSVALPIAPGIGYIAIRAVSERASRELEAALALLGAERLDGLVLDLRGNLGGRLDEALAIADLFLEAGQKIGSVAKRNEFPAVYSARSGSRYPRLDVAILVDHQTASAAEIVAAALRDNLQTRLLGERTLGKGLVQTTIPLGEGTAVRLTTGRWLSPNGTAIDGGLTPDLVVSPDPAGGATRRTWSGRPHPDGDPSRPSRGGGSPTRVPWRGFGGDRRRPCRAGRSARLGRGSGSRPRSSVSCRALDPSPPAEALLRDGLKPLLGLLGDPVASPRASRYSSDLPTRPAREPVRPSSPCPMDRAPGPLISEHARQRPGRRLP